MSGRHAVGVVGTGNIGTDLMEKLRRSELIDVAIFAGIDPDSPGIERAKKHGIPTATTGAAAVLERADELTAVFEATSAAVHKANARDYREAGLLAIDLTPAHLGPAVVPAVNAGAARDAENISLTTCGGQATTPMVAAVNQVQPVQYAEIVATLASGSAGPGTRQNIDEFTVTTAGALRSIGGAQESKAIIILNPADPPLLMRNTVVCVVRREGLDAAAVRESVEAMAAGVRGYAPGYRIVAGPEISEHTEPGYARVTVFLEVAGAGDFLPEYAGNLDIMTSAAIAVAESLVDDAEMAA